MALEIRQRISQDLRLTQELVMTPQLQQAIKLLQLTRMELVDKVQEELEENPLLEEVKEEPPEEVAPEPGPDARLDDPPEAAEPGEVERPSDIPEVDWERFLNQYEAPPHSDRPIDVPEEIPAMESYSAPETTLQEHLMWQLRMSELEGMEREAAAVIIGNLDDQGYLCCTLDEVVEMADCTLEQAELALDHVQEFDPVGVASRDLAECLRSQALEVGSSALVLRVIDEGLNYLETKNYKKLARKLGADFDDVVEAARQIALFEPRPGRAFSTEQTDYVVPDVYVRKESGEYVVHLNEEGLPQLRVSPYYKSILQSQTEDGKAAKGYIQERMQAALWLIKSIQQRQQTLFKVATSIVKFQREFLDRGVAHLRPLILKDVAEDIEMHESTVSRVTTGKYMYTPQGTFELKYFFSSAIQREGAGDLSSRSVKERIREVVSKEDPKNPLSDIQIAKILLDQFGLKIARRTVSKYRESMGILPSSSRRSYF